MKHVSMQNVDLSDADLNRVDLSSSDLLDAVLDRGRGRDTGRPVPPAQIRTGAP